MQYILTQLCTRIHAVYVLTGIQTSLKVIRHCIGQRTIVYQHQVVIRLALKLRPRRERQTDRQRQLQSAREREREIH